MDYKVINNEVHREGTVEVLRSDFPHHVLMEECAELNIVLNV